MGLFSSQPKTLLGIDIGDSAIKMVELSARGKKIHLLNYGFSEDLSQTKLTATDDLDYLATAIAKVKKDVGILGNRACVSLPSFSVFSAVVNLDNVNPKTIANQVSEEAKKVIPLPLSEMVLDWKIIPGTDPTAGTKVFLTGSPKKLIKRYISVFQKAKIELASLETETFSLIRSLLGNDPATVMLIDLGANSSDICIVKESIPYLNRSLTVSGAGVNDAIAQKLNLQSDKAERMKIDLSLNREEQTGEVPALILAAIDPIITEARYMLELFQSEGSRKVEKIILTGGGSMLVNLAAYLENALNLRVVIGNPWFRVNTSLELQPVLNEVGPKLAVAVGLALRGIA